MTIEDASAYGPPPTAESAVLAARRADIVKRSRYLLPSPLISAALAARDGRNGIAALQGPCAQRVTWLQRCEPSRTSVEIERMDYRQPIKFSDLLDIIKRRLDRGHNYCVYSKLWLDNPTLDTICYLDTYPDISENDEEIFSDFVVGHSLHLLYRDELLQDVIESVLSQKADASPEQILKAIIYYDERDTYLYIV